MLNIVIPMAGSGTRFIQQGYKLPKPLIPVHGIPMIQVVVNNLRPTCPHRFIFVCQSAHLHEYALEQLLEEVAPGCTIIPLDHVTDGAACTVLKARQWIDNDAMLMIANCDQWIHFSIDHYLNAFDTSKYAGFIMTMTSDDPKWSYAQRDQQGTITRVVEKQVVSDEATVGIYNFTRGADFVRAADGMIAADDRVKGEFYVAPVYTRLISKRCLVETLSIGTDQEGMYGLGTPDDLEHFLQCGFEQQLRDENEVSSRAA